MAYLFSDRDWVLMLCMMPRVIRPIKLWTYVRQQEMDLQVDVRKLAVLKFGILLFGSMHWLGCMLFWLSRLMDFDTSSGSGTMVGQFQ
ncbi:hypothetical protein CYMTET_36333, partial [Cymbomonas tetramitiformis]